MSVRHAAATLFSLLLAASGCYDPAFPDSMAVVLNSQTQLSVEAPIYSGPPALANTTWAVYTEDPDAPVAIDLDHPAPATGRPMLVARIEFGPRGEILRIYENRFVRTTLPETILPDGQLHASEMPGASYVGAPYGGQIADAAAATGLARLVVGPVELVSATIFIRGTLVDGRWDGVLGYELVIPPGAAAFNFRPGTTSYEYAMYAVRE